MPNFLDRSAILSRTALPSQEVDIPEWQGTVYIRSMTVGEREAFEKEVGKHDKKYMREILAIACICDPNTGNKLFTYGDIDALSGLEAQALDRIFAAAVILNGIGRDDIAELKKTFETIRSGDSSSNSLATSAAQSANSNGI